jgi:hypothetical protein
VNGVVHFNYNFIRQLNSKYQRAQRTSIHNQTMFHAYKISEENPMKKISGIIASTAIATVLSITGLGLAGFAAAAPVPSCHEWSHPTLVSPTVWGCAASSDPQLDRLGLPGSAGLPGGHHHVASAGHGEHHGHR